MPGTMITWFDLQSRNLNVLHVFRDSLGAWVFSMQVLRNFLSISPKQYFLLPFRKSKLAFLRYPKRDFHMYQSETKAIIFLISQKFEVTMHLRWFLRNKSNRWIFFWNVPWMFSTKHCFEKKKNNKRINVKHIWNNSYF